VRTAGAASESPSASRPKIVSGARAPVGEGSEAPSSSRPKIVSGARAPVGEGSEAPSSSRPRIVSQARAPMVARPAAEPAAAEPAPISERATVPIPEPAPTPDSLPTAPIPQSSKADAPLSDLFGGEGESAPNPQGPISDVSAQAPAAAEEPNDPFAALGGGDPSQEPPIGEATKFFIAQSGVNKRNPPWKIALFVLGGPGLVVGILFLLSTLKIVPLEVTRTNAEGEEVKESFFSAGGVDGIKDLFSGEAKKKKADAEKLKLAAAEKRRKQAALADKGPGHETPDKPAKPEKVDAALALIYGPGGTEKQEKGPRVRLEDRGNQKTVDSSGLSAEASQKIIADKIKGFEGCIEAALRRNPNLAVGPIDVVLNVGASGAVTSSSINPAKHNNSDWGQCMRDVAKRIVFPKSDGETEVSLPLKVGVAL
jgi:hypothetical protein